ncbi:MAG TPA: glycerophosphodiester phosphodiesterase [Gemmatimonadales bacterium]|nr:glycerophosphodiester phosphodiesterase [Gemmatimonadales bacterium]
MNSSHPALDLAAHPIIAHRGGGGLAPENTIPAFARALELGAEVLELDVRATADGVPVVIHDPTLDRTTDRRGAVAKLTLQQIQQADAGARFTTDGGRSFPFRGKGIAVPTLADVLDAFPEAKLLIELKTAAVQSAVRRLLEEDQAAARCVLAAADEAALAAFRAPPFHVAASGPETGRLFRGSLLGGAPVAVSYHCLSVPLRYRGIPVATRRFIALARGLGVPVHVWTVDHPDTARRLWRRGVAGIVTNRPDLMLPARAAHFPSERAVE